MRTHSTQSSKDNQSGMHTFHEGSQLTCNDIQVGVELLECECVGVLALDHNQNRFGIVFCARLMDQNVESCLSDIVGAFEQNGTRSWIIIGQTAIHLSVWENAIYNINSLENLEAQIALVVVVFKAREQISKSLSTATSPTKWKERKSKLLEHGCIVSNGLEHPPHKLLESGKVLSWGVSVTVENLLWFGRVFEIIGGPVVQDEWQHQ